MTKSHLISTIKSCSTAQAQLRYDHILTYLQAHKHYPRLRGVKDKVMWFKEIDLDLATTIQKMSDLGYNKPRDYRMIARMLTQYHILAIPDIVRIPKQLSKSTIISNDSVVLHNIIIGIDIVQGDSRYSRNLDTDLQKLLGTHNS